MSVIRKYQPSASVTSRPCCWTWPGNFCRDKSPIAAVRAQLDTASGFDQALWDEMVALGWTGIALPESCGGSGLGIGALVPVVEVHGPRHVGYAADQQRTGRTVAAARRQ